ncbi:MAG: hypothetical protein WCO02_07005 [Bacteroidota bacterium]
MFVCDGFCGMQDAGYRISCILDPAPARSASMHPSSVILHLLSVIPGLSPI